MIKITKDSQVWIWGSTPEVSSGGAEILNFLAAHLKSKGVPAKMFNWCRSPYEQAPRFKGMFNVNCGSWEDIKNSEDTVLILPDTMIEHPGNLPWFVNELDKTQIIIWWLSSASDLRGKGNLTKRMQMYLLKRMEHRSINLCESECALRDCLHYGVNNCILFQHPVNKVFFNYPITSKKERVILYNSSKPETKRVVEEVIKPLLPNEKFIETSNLSWNEMLTKEDLCDKCYDVAKVYIDFCLFEGREMMPREAAIRNCVLFLGRYGDADTFNDYPIDDYYKIDIVKETPEEICAKIVNALDTYETRVKDFEFIKQKCLYEPMKWEWETEELFGVLYDKNKKFLKYDI